MNALQDKISNSIGAIDLNAPLFAHPETLSDSALILIVDDTPANLDVISDALTDAGFEIAIATSGERALKQLEHFLPDLILLDVMMPGMSGFELCEALKGEKRTRDIPILFMTALADAENKVKGFNLGAVDYITKPFQEVEVLARVKTHLQLRQFNKNLEELVARRTADLRAALQQLESSQLQLLQSEKMSALGNLMAGVAHEINNPLGFIGGNIQVLQDSLADLAAIVQGYRQELPEPSPELAEDIEELDLDFLLEDIPKTMTSMQEGVRRIYNISTSLRTFSRTDTDTKTEFDLHEGLDSTLLILKYRLKANGERPAVEIIKNYGEIPPVKCHPGQLNQVFMNLLANALDALEETNIGKTFQEIEAAPNRITINTKLSEDKKEVSIAIADNGKGMSEAVKAKIFEQGFTTKKVGKGTGLGMAIAKSIIEEKHGGTIACQSELGRGTKFIISLLIS